MRPAAKLNLLATLLVGGLAIASGSDLPQRIPVHFDLLGNPDGWASKQHFLGGLVIMLMVMQLWLRVAVPALVRHTPARMLSLPNRDFWTATPTRREEAAARIVDVMDWTGAFLALTMLLILNMVRQAADTEPFLHIAPRNQVWVLMGVLSMFTVLILTAAARQFQVPRDQGAPGARAP